MIKVRVYNIEYKVWDGTLCKEWTDYTQDWLLENEMTWEELEEWRDSLPEEIVIDIDPEWIDNDLDYIKEILPDCITDEVEADFSSYNYEILLESVRDWKLSQLGI